MTEREIKDRAPDNTATHYSDEFEIVYLRRNKGAWNCWGFNGWFLYVPKDDEIIKPL